MDRTVTKLRVGLAGIGLKTYWPQFEGLEDRLHGYLGVVQDKVEAILPVIQRAKVPVVLLNLQPETAIDYVSFNQMTSRTAMPGAPSG